MPDSAPQLPGVGDAPIGIGHNQPPEELEPEQLQPEVIPELDPDRLSARLSADYGAMMDRFVELAQGAQRVPATIDNEAEATRVLEFIGKQCRPLTDEAKQAHTKEKNPYLECGRAVDKFFLRRIDDFNVSLHGAIRSAQGYFDRKKAEQRRREEEQRRRAVEEARQAAAEAKRLEELAQQKAMGLPHERTAAVALGRQAQAAAERAEAAQAIVEAPPAPVRLHGEYGTTAFAKQQWKIEVLDPTLIPLGYLRLCEEAVFKAIKRGILEIPGLRIYQDEKFIIKRC